MPRLLFFLLFISLITFAASCSKDSGDSPEEDFYGTWVKGPNAGDTLQFYKKNGRNIMRSNQSFNPQMYAPVEYDFKYKNGKLSYRLSPTPGFEFREIQSFIWKNAGSQFEINGFELYMFMSSSMTKFTFTKVL